MTTAAKKASAPKTKAPTTPSAPTTRTYLRCPVCGRGAATIKFDEKHTIETLTATFVGKGKGTNGGAVIWSRRPMILDEAKRVLHQVKRAFKVIEETVASLTRTV